MARKKKYLITLSDKEVQKLKSVIRKKETSKTVIRRCQVLLDLDEAHGASSTYEQCAKSNGVCMATVANTAKQYAAEGIDSIIALKRNVHSDHARRKMDGRAEAHIIEIACSPAPEGHARWTLQLLEDEAKIRLDTPVSRETIRRTLKKQASPS